jgi:hypothetical protein
MCLAAGCVTGPLDATGQDDPATGVTAQPVLGPGNPFNYGSARDEQLACFGIAAHVSSNCRDIVDPDDRQMCIAMSDHNTSACFAIADRAARLLGIDRVTLYNRLRKHGADTE